MAVAVVKDTTAQDEAPLALGLLGCDSSGFKMFQDVSSTSEFYDSMIFYDLRTHYGESYGESHPPGPPVHMKHPTQTPWDLGDILGPNSTCLSCLFLSYV